MALGEAVLNGDLVQSSAANNATATATKAATANARHFIGAIYADYSATVSAIKTVTLKFGTTAKFIWRWDFSAGPFVANLAWPVHSDYNEAASVELEASGTGGTTGRVGFGVMTA